MIKKTDHARNLSLKIVDPQTNSARRQPKSKKITITIPVEGVRRCNDTESHNNNTEDTKIDLAVAIAIPVTTVALIIFALIVAFIFHRSKKQKKRGRRSVDVNPTYGEYEHSENGEMTHNSVEVIDASPYYGDSTEDWEGAVVADRNENYE